jgi:mercuric ion binding protein
MNNGDRGTGGTVMKKFVAAKTVTLSVSGMTCTACSDTVKKALQKVEGVGMAEVNYDKKEAVVTYDDAKTGVEALTKAKRPTWPVTPPK